MRTGFKAGHNLKPPHKLEYPEEAWMAQELQEGILRKTQGLVQCAMSLDSPEYW
jgi:predicted N-acetyltransferase YhbS